LTLEDLDRGAAAVEEQLTVVFLRVPAIVSRRGAITVNYCDGGTCN